MKSVWQDLRHASKNLLKKPSFTCVVVLTLALGIGANTAIFSLIYGILLRPFPYRDPDRLVKVDSIYTKTSSTERGCSLLDIEDWRRLNSTLVDIGAHTTFDSDVRGDGPSEPVRLTQLNAGALSAPGITPVLGRLFLPEEDIPGGDVHKAVISYRLWENRFNSDADIIGKSLQTSLRSFTIVGVMPPGSRFPENTDVWTPMESWYAMNESAYRNKKRDSRWYATIARLKPGVTIEQAQSDLNNVAAALEEQYPRENEGIRIRLTPLRDAEVGNIRPYLLMLVATVGFVLLICCANVANLMLAQGAARQREYSICAALGASRWRLVRTMLTEGLLLGLLGGVVGVGLAFAAVRALLTMIPVTLPFWMKIEVDAPVLLFTFGSAVATSVLFGLTPALSSSRVDLNSLLKEGARGTSSGSRLRSALVVAELALSLVLVAGAGLMMRSFLLLQNVKTGFQSDNLLVARVTNFRTGTRADRASALSNFHEQVLSRLRALPGVTSAGATNSLPYSRIQNERTKADLFVKGLSSEELKHTTPLAGADVSPGYLEMMGIPLLNGRLLDERDRTDSPMVLLISERASKTFFPDRDPIGQQILWGPESAENPYCTIVGVVGDVKHQATEDESGMELYYPYTQYPVTNAYYVMRTQVDPATLALSVRRVVNEVDQNAGIVFTKTMDQLIGETLWQRRLWGVLLGVFATTALLLAAVGIYGVMAYMVTQRTREIGIRMAFGARKQDVISMVFRRALILVAIGCAIGLGVAFALGRTISSLLYGVSTTDALTLVSVPLLLMLVGLLAAFVPALRAARTDPMVALRSE